MGPCYYYMWYELWARNGRYFQLGEDLVEPYFIFLEMPVSSGEVCYGGAMGLGLARTLLWGRPDPACQQPDCGTRECGSDGCGGSCGTCAADETCVAGYCEAGDLDGGDGSDGSDASDASDGGDASDAGGDPEGDDASDAGTDASDAGGDAPPADPGSDGGTVDGSGDAADSQIAADEDPGTENGCSCGSTPSPADGFLALLLALVITRSRKLRKSYKTRA
jgi:MYXO-CTERM domain-containing protein